MPNTERQTGSSSPFRILWETDGLGSASFRSAEWYEYTGERSSGSRHEDWLQSIHPDDRDYLLGEWQKTLAARGSHRYDIVVRLRRHDGQFRQFRIQATPHRTNDGGIERWIGTCTDIHSPALAKQAANDDAEDASAGERTTTTVAHAGKRGGIGARRSTRFGLTPIEQRLFLIVLVGLLPLVLLASSTLVYNAHRQRQQVLEASAGTMRAIMTAVDSELGKSLATLDTLAASPRLAQDDFKDFAAEAKELLSRHPNWANIILSTPEAQQVVNARLPYGSELPDRIDPESISEAANTGKPGFSNVILTPIRKIHTFTARIPIFRDGKVAYVLSAAIYPASIRELLTQQHIAERNVVSIFDRHYNVVARSLNHDEWLGKPAAPQLLTLLRMGENTGIAITRTLEGLPVYTFYIRSDVTGWSAALGIPVDSIDRPIIASYLILGGAIALSAALGLLAAFIISRTVTRPMRELGNAAEAVRRGEPPVVPDTSLPEIRQVASALSASYVERENLLQSEREARQLEEKARISAENASKAKDEFLAMLGHELRNPLAAISSASQVLDLSEQSSNDIERQAKAIIRRQTQHLARLTGDLLDAGRVIMGKIHIDRKPVDLADLVQGTLDTMTNTGQLAHHRVIVSLAPAWVRADATRVEQIVANLLANAVKYTPEQGAIDVSLQHEAGRAVLRVRDTGLGLELDLLPRIFDLFVQGQRSLDRSQGGLGIGLTLVRRLVDLHDGTVEAKSEGPGKGSEFIVRLPAIERPEAEVPPAAAVRTAHRCRIVLVEDNADLRMILRAYLEMEGHLVTEAADGPAGVEAILRERPEVALVDVGLPRLDGYGVARAVREQMGKDVRLIAMTGYGADEDIRKGLEAGFDAYLVKPVNPEALREMLADPDTDRA